MKAAQRWLAIPLAVSVTRAIYLSVPDVALPAAPPTDRAITPAGTAVARQIRAIRIGDQIRMRGLLVDYTVSSDGREVFTRRTSLTRKDTGNGACEILYVTAVHVLRPGSRLRADAARYAWYA